MIAGGIKNPVHQRDLAERIVKLASRESNSVEILKAAISVRIPDPEESRDMIAHIINGEEWSANAEGYSNDFTDVRAMYSVMSTGITARTPPESIFVSALKFVAAAVAGATLGYAVSMLLSFITRKLVGEKSEFPEPRGLS